RVAVAGIFQRWLGAPRTRPGANPISFDSEEFRTFVIKIGSLITLCFLNLVLFVGAIIVTAVSVAQSFDDFDTFVPNSVFWTGIFMGVTALVIGAISGWALLHEKFSVKDFIVTEPAPELDINIGERFFTPFFEGLSAGFRRESPMEH